ncbi:hypothetical protein KXD40_005030 [Peronospora effusa]|nr:hypothetical protein KXD40_005030 [Peronospora effusa]
MDQVGGERRENEGDEMAKLNQGCSFWCFSCGRMPPTLFALSTGEQQHRREEVAGRRIGFHEW